MAFSKAFGRAVLSTLGYTLLLCVAACCSPSSPDGPGKVWAAQSTDFFYGGSFSADGKRIAFGVGRELRICEATKGAVLLTIPDVPPGPETVFNADGKSVVTFGYGQVRRWNLDQRTSVAIGEHQRDEQNAASADGRLVPLRSLSNKGAGEGFVKLAVWDTATDQRMAEIETRRTFQTDALTTRFPLAMSPDGQLVAGDDGDEMIAVWTTDGTRVARMGPMPAGHLRFSPDNELLAVHTWEGTSASSTLHIWDLKRGVLLYRLSSHSRPAAFLPDGKTMVAEEWLTTPNPGGKSDTVNCKVYVLDWRSGKALQTIHSGQFGAVPQVGELESLQVSPDGKLLVECRNTPRLYNSATVYRLGK